MDKAEIIASGGSRSERTRAAIIAAGGQLFAANGFAATGIRDIARSAGVNLALISYHFGGKAGLYDAILKDVINAARRSLADRQNDPSLTREEQLVRGFADALTARPYAPAMILRDQMDLGRLADPKAGNILRGFMELTEQLLAALSLDEEAQRWDPQIVHLCIVGPLIHFLVSTPMREAVAQKLDLPLSLPSLDEFITVHAAILHKALSPP